MDAKTLEAIKKFEEALEKIRGLDYGNFYGHIDITVRSGKATYCEERIGHKWD